MRSLRPFTDLNGYGYIYVAIEHELDLGDNWRLSDPLDARYDLIVVSPSGRHMGLQYA